MIGDKRGNNLTPGRAHRKTPQVYLEAQQEFEAQQEGEVTKELRIGNRGASTTATSPSAPPLAPKKAAPQTQQDWALKNRILDLERQLARTQVQASRMGEEGQRLAELNLATSVESREVNKNKHYLFISLSLTPSSRSSCVRSASRLT